MGRQGRRAPPSSNEIDSRGRGGAAPLLAPPYFAEPARGLACPVLDLKSQPLWKVAGGSRSEALSNLTGVEPASCSASNRLGRDLEQRNYVGAHDARDACEADKIQGWDLRRDDDLVVGLY